MTVSRKTKPLNRAKLKQQFEALRQLGPEFLKRVAAIALQGHIPDPDKSALNALRSFVNEAARQIAADEAAAGAMPQELVEGLRELRIAAILRLEGALGAGAITAARTTARLPEAIDFKANGDAPSVTLAAYVEALLAAVNADPAAMDRHNAQNPDHVLPASGKDSGVEFVGAAPAADGSTGVDAIPQKMGRHSALLEAVLALELALGWRSGVDRSKVPAIAIAADRAELMSAELDPKKLTDASLHRYVLELQKIVPDYPESANELRKMVAAVPELGRNGFLRLAVATGAPISASGPTMRNTAPLFVADPDIGVQIARRGAECVVTFAHPVREWRMNRGEAGYATDLMRAVAKRLPKD